MGRLGTCHAGEQVMLEAVPLCCRNLRKRLSPGVHVCVFENMCACVHVCVMENS